MELHATQRGLLQHLVCSKAKHSCLANMPCASLILGESGVQKAVKGFVGPGPMQEYIEEPMPTKTPCIGQGVRNFGESAYNIRREYFAYIT